ncbi:hypothetical protein [Demequina sp.]|uniref:hypothetical protein n=1 Tax=Demequina sp. TaxID=2050685 RepID=UPI0025C15551|nr:hypothetical protein [Demequina sp.]
MPTSSDTVDAHAEAAPHTVELGHKRVVRGPHHRGVDGIRARHLGGDDPAARLKHEAARAIIVFWCVLGFVAAERAGARTTEDVSV